MQQLFISPKLRLFFILPALTALAVSIPLIWILTSRLIEDAAAAQLLNTLPVVAALMENRLDAEPEELQAIVTGLTTTDRVRITVIDRQGLVLADNSRSWDQVLAMEDHSGRPEFSEAVARGSGSSIRQNATTGIEYIYAARTATGPSGTLYVVRLAQPLRGLQSLRKQLSLTLAIGFLTAIGVMSIWLWWVERKVSRSAPTVLEAADRLQQGDFSYRVDFAHQAGLGRLARFLNGVAENADRQIRSLETERELLLSVISSMREGVLVADAEGLTKMANPAFCQIFGLHSEWIDRTPLELTHQPQLDSLMRRSLSTGEEQIADLEISEPAPRTVALAVSSLGTEVGAVVVARDITDLVQLTRIRRDFVANVSHELKTPLTAIRGYAETLRDGAVDDEATAPKFLDSILQQCGRLQALLEDLLTLSRLESLEGTGEVTQVEVAKLLQACLDPIAHQVGEKNIRLTVINEARPTIRGDREALERLVINLLDNAVKYNRPGGSVTAKLAENTEGAVFEVADSGIGIPAASLSRVFERFYRVDKGRSRGEGGTGLGLAIVKHVAQLHGGHVEVKSRLGKGSVFRVFLPFGNHSKANP